MTQDKEVVLFPPLVVSRAFLFCVFFAMASAVMKSLATSPLAQDPLSIKARSLLEDIIAGKELYQTYKDDYPDLSHQHEDIIMELLSSLDDELSSLRSHVRGMGYT